MKTLQSLFITTLIALSQAPQVSAQSNPRDRLGVITPPPNTSPIPLNAAIDNLISFAITSGIVVFLFIFIWGAWEWISSAGEKGRLDSAKGRMTSGVIGLIILALAFVVMNLVRNITYSGIP